MWKKGLRRKFQKQSGFTLIEILIVIIILGILAVVILPHVSVSSGDAKLSTLKTNLDAMRRIVELYYTEHNNTYPGVNGDNGVLAGNVGLAAKGFERQLTRYTDVNGDVEENKDPTYKFGPYIKGGELPMNPYNNENDVKCDITTTDITAKASDGSSGWKFYTKTGVLIANDGSNDIL